MTLLERMALGMAMNHIRGSSKPWQDAYDEYLSFRDSYDAKTMVFLENIALAFQSAMLEFLKHAQQGVQDQGYSNLNLELLAEMGYEASRNAQPA